MLAQAGWSVCSPAEANISAHRGVAIREFPLKQGHGFADYLLYIDGRAAGVIEAKKTGATLVGVETQSARYTAGLPDALPAWRRHALGIGPVLLGATCLAVLYCVVPNTRV